MILKSETRHFHRLDLARQRGFSMTIYDEDQLRLAATASLPAAFATAGMLIITIRLQPTAW